MSADEDEIDDEDATQMMSRPSAAPDEDETRMMSRPAAGRAAWAANARPQGPTDTNEMTKPRVQVRLPDPLPLPPPAGRRPLESYSAPPQAPPVQAPAPIPAPPPLPPPLPLRSPGSLPPPEPYSAPYSAPPPGGGPAPGARGPALAPRKVRSPPVFVAVMVSCTVLTITGLVLLGYLKMRGLW